MSRKPRSLSETGLYHITSRGNNRQSLFQRDADFQIYLSLLRNLKQVYSFDLYHYCLMTNHVHLLIRFTDQNHIKKVMQRLNGTYAKYFCREYQYIGHVFHQRYKSFPIEKDSYWLDCGRYIERNPLNAVMVKNLVDYFWSSYAFYAFDRPDPLLTVSPLFLELSLDQEARKAAYQKYVSTVRPYENFEVNRKLI